MKMLDLFSGIGGFAYAAQQIWGDELEIVAFCEIDSFCQKVLNKHWPGVKIYSDIKGILGHEFGQVDLITGGFPCQDISQANTNNPQGLKGERSGLWNEYRRLVSNIRPRYFIVENTSALLYRGLARVLGDISELRYNAIWEVIQAKEIGAPHQRARVWVLAYANGDRLFQSLSYGRFEKIQRRKTPFWSKYWDEVRTGFTGHEPIPTMEETTKEATDRPWIRRVSNGLPDGMDRLKSLGNAIVPQVAMTIMERIKSLDKLPRL